MIRVGFRMIGGAGWQGGRNYLWNLLHAITSRSERRVQPVLLVRPDEDPGDLRMPGVEIFTTSMRRDSERARRIGRLIEVSIRRNPIEAHWLARAKIDVLSHCSPVGGVPTISWIYDVQHRRLPELASRRERIVRDLFFREMLRDAAIVLTSSEDARNDLERFYAADTRKCRVLRFVSQPRTNAVSVLPLDELRARHHLPARFFHLPNQMWKHKNHQLVVEAMHRIPDVVVVATGATENYRHPETYGDLMGSVARFGLTDRFLHLGMVPFQDLMSVMRHSVAVINPSRFEGWSSTVEEAKSLGKRVLVSDIGVHREQAAPRASYFPTHDADELARQLADAWQQHDPSEDARAMAAAAEALPQRTREFAEHYESIVEEAAAADLR